MARVDGSMRIERCATHAPDGAGPSQEMRERKDRERTKEIGRLTLLARWSDRLEDPAGGVKTIGSSQAQAQPKEQ